MFFSFCVAVNLNEVLWKLLTMTTSIVILKKFLFARTLSWFNEEDNKHLYKIRSQLYLRRYTSFTRLHIEKRLDNCA